MSSPVPTVTLDDVNVTAPAPTSSLPTPYARRILQFTFQLGEGSFGDTGSDKLTVSGLRATVQIGQAHLAVTGRAVIRIFGLTLNQINTLTKAGLYFKYRKDLVAIQAGDEKAGLTEIFNGRIYEAYPDFADQPNGGFVVIATDDGPNGAIKVAPVPPVSFPGAVSVVTALEQIVKPQGLNVENNKVNVILASPYFQGTVWQQMLSAIRAANISGVLDSVNSVLAIWPKSGARSGSALLIAPETGMIGYPEFMQNRIRARTLWAPGLKGPGVLVQVKSQFTAATGSWRVDNIDYNLSSELPGGPWEMAITATPTSLPQG